MKARDAPATQTSEGLLEIVNLYFSHMDCIKSFRRSAASGRQRLQIAPLFRAYGVVGLLAGCRMICDACACCHKDHDYKTIPNVLCPILLPQMSMHMILYLLLHSRTRPDWDHAFR